MQRPLFVSRAFVVVALVAVGPLAGCDLFDQVKCTAPADCPSDAPFCTDGLCSKTDGSGRTHTGEGEGEGEGEGGGEGGEGEGGAQEITCSDDGICESEVGGLCYQGAADIATANTCVPPASDLNAHCESDPDVDGGPRTAGGPVIWDVQATPGGDGCWTNISFHFYAGLDGQPISNAFVELVSHGSGATQSIESADDATGTVTLAQACASGLTSGQRAGIELGLGVGHSNVACLPPLP